MAYFTVCRQYYDLLKILEVGGNPETTKYLNSVISDQKRGIDTCSLEISWIEAHSQSNVSSFCTQSR
jgi:hypothetical protein